MYALELAGDDDAFAAAEASTAAAGLDVVAPGVALARGLEADRARALAYTHRASRYLGRTAATVPDSVRLLAAATLDVDGTVAVRARDVRGTSGVDTQAAERRLGQVLVDRGLAVDLEAPDHELRALYADDTAVLGWLAVESVRDYGDRRPTDRPFFQPGSMSPLDARAVANLAGARPGATLLDPMCGTGGVLLEAGLAGADVVGGDAQAKMVRGTRENLAAALDDYEVARWDATRLPLADDAVDGVAFDAPYGRQSKVETHALADLVAGALREAHRVAPRAVVVADRDWRDDARAAGWQVSEVFERRVHRSLVRHVHVLDRHPEAT